MRKLLLCMSACALLGACATDPASSESTVDKEYRTGSNIPARAREGVIVVSPEEFERRRDAATANTGRGRGN